MSDPQPVPGRKTPPRAEPLQPDQPGKGTAKKPSSDDPAERAATAQRSTVERQKEQSADALSNVRDGYD